MEEDLEQKLQELVRECVRRNITDHDEAAAEISKRLKVDCDAQLYDKISGMIDERLSGDIKPRYSGPSVNGFRTSFESDAELLAQLKGGGW